MIPPVACQSLHHLYELDNLYCHCHGNAKTAWTKRNNIKTIAYCMALWEKSTLMSFGPKKGAQFETTWTSCLTVTISVVLEALWKQKDTSVSLRSDQTWGLSFAWIRQVKVTVKSSKFKLWQVMAIPCSIAYILPVTISVMHRHSIKTYNRNTDCILTLTWVWLIIQCQAKK